MLNTKFTDLAIALARTYTDRNQALVPKAGSTIDRINVMVSQHRQSTVTNRLLPHDGQDPEAKYAEVKQYLLDQVTPNLNDTENGLTRFAIAFEEQFEKQKANLLNLVRITYNHALPLVRELHEQVMQGVEANVLGVSNRFNVIVDDDQSVLRCGALIQQAMAYQNVQVVDSAALYAGAFIPALSEDELADRIKTGISDIDDVIGEYLATKPNALFDIYNKVFKDIALQNPVDYDPNRVFAELITKDADAVYNAALIFILAKSFYDTPPEGVSAPTPTAFKTKLTVIREQAGKQLYIKARVSAQHVENGTLVTYYDPKQYKVYVTNDVYQDFLAAGGKPEILYGALFTDIRPYTAEQLLARAEEFIATYHRIHSTLVMTDINNRQAYQRRLAAEVFRNQIKDAIAGEDVPGEVVTSLYQDFATVYDSFTSEDHENFLLACIKLIARTRFKNTDIEKFLISFYRLGERFPTLAPRDVGSLVVIEYVGQWLGSMINVVKAD